MPERILYSFFLFLRTIRLLRILRLWQIIVLPFDDSALTLYLRDVQIRYMEACLFLHILPDLFICRLTALILHPFFHIHINVDMRYRISQN